MTCRGHRRSTSKHWSSVRPRATRQRCPASTAASAVSPSPPTVPGGRCRTSGKGGGSLWRRETTGRLAARRCSELCPHGLIALGQAALAAGRLGRARAAFRETLDLPAAGEDIMFTSGTVKGMGGVAAGLGDWPAAARLFAAADAHAATVEVAIERPAVRAIYAVIKARVGAVL